MATRARDCTEIIEIADKVDTGRPLNDLIQSKRRIAGGEERKKLKGVR